MWRARLSHLVRGVVFHYDNNAHSNGLKLYVAHNYTILKKLNPSLTLLQGSGTLQQNDEPVDLTRGRLSDVPHIVVEYDEHKQEAVSVAGMTEEQVESTLEQLATKGLTLSTPPDFDVIDIVHAYHPPLPPYRANLGPGWQYAEI